MDRRARPHPCVRAERTGRGVMIPAKLTLNHEATILSRAIDPENGNWSPGIAEGILTIRLSPADRERMNELAAKAREGALGPDEEMELESYRQVTRLLELMKAKARVSL